MPIFRSSAARASRPPAWRTARPPAASLARAQVCGAHQARSHRRHRAPPPCRTPCPWSCTAAAACETAASSSGPGARRRARGPTRHRWRASSASCTGGRPVWPPAGALLGWPSPRGGGMGGGGGSLHECWGRAQPAAAAAMPPLMPPPMPPCMQVCVLQAAARRGAAPRRRAELGGGAVRAALQQRAAAAEPDSRPALLQPGAPSLGWLGAAQQGTLGQPPCCRRCCWVAAGWLPPARQPAWGYQRPLQAARFNPQQAAGLPSTGLTPLPCAAGPAGRLRAAAGAGGGAGLARARAQRAAAAASRHVDHPRAPARLPLLPASNARAAAGLAGERHQRQRH
jgi:hypothetical protein